jgi:hypothetical protein
MLWARAGRSWPCKMAADLQTLFSRDSGWLDYGVPEGGREGGNEGDREAAEAGRPPC